MLAKMILKLLLKASVPLVMMAGVSFYMLSSRGIDPMVVVKRMLPEGGVSVSDALGDARQLVSTGAEKVSGVTGKTSSASKRETLYRWKDENGVTQFSNMPPSGVANVSEISVNPNQNVVASMPAKPASETRGQEEPAQQMAGANTGDAGQAALQNQTLLSTAAERGESHQGTDGMITSGEQLPGIAGDMLKGVDVSRILGKID